MPRTSKKNKKSPNPAPSQAELSENHLSVNQPTPAADGDVVAASIPLQQADVSLLKSPETPTQIDTQPQTQSAELNTQLQGDNSSLTWEPVEEDEVSQSRSERKSIIFSKPLDCDSTEAFCRAPSETSTYLDSQNPMSRMSTTSSMYTAGIRIPENSQDSSPLNDTENEPASYRTPQKIKCVPVGSAGPRGGCNEETFAEAAEEDIKKSLKTPVGTDLSDFYYESDGLDADKVTIIKRYTTVTCEADYYTKEGVSELYSLLRTSQANMTPGVHGDPLYGS